MIRFAPSAVLVLAFVSGAANAALHVTRHSTITDDHGGSLVVDTTGTVEQPGADLASHATFQNFHATDGGRVINGTINGERERTGEEHSSVYNGSLTFAGNDANGNPTTTTLEFRDFKVTRERFRPTFGGTLILDGKTLDTAQMPTEARGLLRHVLRLFRFD